MLGKIYADAYGLDVMMVRAFNYIGPNQTPMFVVADFCQQAAEIEAGKREAVMRVGNLSAKRDFTDVRDVIRAYALIMEHGKAGETYNVGSGHAVSIQQILDTIISLSKADIGRGRPGKIKTGRCADHRGKGKLVEVPAGNGRFIRTYDRRDIRAGVKR